jgi:hypothetical protein
MRAGLGLLALLVTIALMIYLFAMIEIPKAKIGKQVQAQAQQYSGRGNDGESAMSSFTAEGKFKGSAIESLKVTGVTAGGAMDTYFGLRPKDAIVAAGGLRLSDTTNGDEEMAKALVAEAFSKHQTLTVKRGGKMIELPLPPGSAIPPLPAAPPAPGPPAPADAPPTPAPNNAAANPAPPSPPPAPAQQDGLHRQLDAIQDAAGK